MLPEEYKKSLVDRLRAEADLRLREKEEKIRGLYSAKLEEIKRGYEEAARRFAEQLTS